MIQGSMVAIVSPMQEDGSLDYDSYRSLIDWHIAKRRLEVKSVVGFIRLDRARLEPTLRRILADKTLREHRPRGCSLLRLRLLLSLTPHEFGLPALSPLPYSAFGPVARYALLASLPSARSSEVVDGHDPGLPCAMSRSLVVDPSSEVDRHGLFSRPHPSKTVHECGKARRPPIGRITAFLPS